MGALEASWVAALGNAFDAPYLKALQSFLQAEKQNGFVVYPESSTIFNAFYHTPFDNVKVVILGQDPYHGANQAHGLSFSVQKGMPTPPSLKNIYKELALEYPAFKTPNCGDLTAWAKQGVLLLNATLTVRASEPGSHQKQGWETFTDHVIATLATQKSGIVFLLWGKYAQQKEHLINPQKHQVLKAAHPSPFSAHSGFFGCNHFVQTNQLLVAQGMEPINWQIVC